MQRSSALIYTSNVKCFIRHKVQLPGVTVAIVIEGISNADLSTINSPGTTISSVGDGDSVDLICLQEVQSPPWF